MHLHRFTIPVAALALLAARPAPAQDDLASIAPADTLLYGEFGAAPLIEAWPDLALARIIAEPEVQEFLGPAGDMLNLGVAAGRTQVLASTGLDPAVLDVFWKARYAFAWNGSLDESAIGILIRVSVAEDPGLLYDLVEGVETLLLDQTPATLTDEDLGGVAVRHLVLEPGAPEIWYQVSNDGVLLALSRQDLEAALRRSGSGEPVLAGSSDFRRSVQRAWRQDGVLFAWCALGELMRISAEESGDAEVAAMRDILFYRSVAYGVDPEPPGIADRMYGILAPDSSMMQLLDAGRGEARAQSFLPAGTGFAFSWRMDMAMAWEWVHGLYGRLFPEVAEMMDTAETRLQESAGVDLKGDLLSRLGPESAFFLDFGGSSLIPDGGLLIEARDPAGLAPVLEALAGATGGYQRSMEYRGHEIHWLELPAVDLGEVEWTPRPAWTFTRGWLVVAPWPQVLKKYLAGLEEGEPRLKDTTDFGGLHRRHSNANGPAASWFYADLVAACTFLLENGAPVLQAIVPSSPGNPVDVARLPTARVVTRHLFGMYMGSNVGEDDFYTEIYSPLGYIGTAIPLGAVGGVVAWQLMRSSATAEPQAVLEEAGD